MRQAEEDRGERMQELNIIYMPLQALEPYAGNARAHGEEDVEAIKKSIEKYGFNDPIGVWSDHNVIVEGHGRLAAAKALGLEMVPCIRLDHLTDEERREYAIMHNKTAELSSWDAEALRKELEDLDLGDFGDVFADAEEFVDGGEYQGEKGSLSEDFIVPPFTVLNSQGGAWTKRKKIWSEKFTQFAGRADELTYSMEGFRKAYGFYMLSGTSIFDPVLCEVMYRWFCPAGGSIFDPFAGGAARGVVAELTGHHYVGIDLSAEQITQNKQEAERLGITPEWYCDDSLNMDEYIKDGSADMVFTCPPYADLEVYSDDPRDISNMSYEDFSDVYARILTRAAAKLKDDRFMAVVIGDVRDKEGIYRGLVGLTADILTAAGLKYYNELIKVGPIGTAAYRARQCFRSRKCVKIHQQVLIFYKGAVDHIQSIFAELKGEEDALAEAAQDEE